MRLARPVYEALPLIYMLIGALAILLAYLDPEGPAPLVAVSIGVAAQIAALTVFLRRQGYRALAREYPCASFEAPSI